MELRGVGEVGFGKNIEPWTSSEGESGWKQSRQATQARYAGIRTRDGSSSAGETALSLKEGRGERYFSVGGVVGRGGEQRKGDII